MSSKPCSVFQRDHVFVALAKGGDALQSAFRLRQQPDRTKAVDGVAVLCKVPAASLARGWLCGDVVGGRCRRRNAIRAVQRD
jgi:hypothetical protein